MRFCRTKGSLIPEQDDNFSPTGRYNFPEETICLPQQDDVPSQVGRQGFPERTLYFPGPDDTTEAGGFPEGTISLPEGDDIAGKSSEGRSVGLRLRTQAQARF